MLKITSIKPSIIPVFVEVDYYIPLAVRTYTAPIGAVYYRVGNFDTSLVEIPIDPSNGQVRGIKLVSIDKVGSDVYLQSIVKVEGLPVADISLISGTRLDEKKDISVTLRENVLYIDWRGGTEIELKASHERLSFFVGDGILLGAAVEGLDSSEISQLRQHLGSPG